MAATGSCDYLEPGVYVYGQKKKYWEGGVGGVGGGGGGGGGGRVGSRFQGPFTLCNNNNNKMKEILPQTRHTIHFYGDKHDLFFFFFTPFKISIL